MSEPKRTYCAGLLAWGRCPVAEWIRRGKKAPPPWPITPPAIALAAGVKTWAIRIAVYQHALFHKLFRRAKTCNGGQTK